MLNADEDCVDVVETSEKSYKLDLLVEINVFLTGYDEVTPTIYNECLFQLCDLWLFNVYLKKWERNIGKQ